MLATLVPLFKEDMSVAAYSLYAQKENLFANPLHLGTGANDGAGNIVGIEVINNISIDILTKDCDIIVPVNNISIYANISEQYCGPKNRIVILLDSSIKPEKGYYERVKSLKQEGYKLAFNKLAVTKIEAYRQMLEYVDYFCVDCTSADPIKLGLICAKLLPGIPIVAENIPTQEIFEQLRDSKLFAMFEGEFYRVPINKKDTTISPLKMNYLKLLKIINTPNFDLTKVAAVISQDPAMTISLLNIVNKLTLNSNISSIKQATALLGQKELKRWLNTTIISSLCSDRPNEITRLSLIRARFAENLACVFGMKAKIEELFLMGLFSVLDYIMDKPMEEALSVIPVSQDIFSALVKKEGVLSDIYRFLLSYEAGEWQEVSRQMILKEINMESIYQAYVDSLKWYKNMFM